MLLARAPDPTADPSPRRWILLGFLTTAMFFCYVHRQALARSFEVNRRFGAGLPEKRARAMSRDLEKILRRVSPDQELVRDLLNLWAPQGADTA